MRPYLKKKSKATNCQNIILAKAWIHTYILYLSILWEFYTCIQCIRSHSPGPLPQQPGICKHHVWWGDCFIFISPPMRWSKMMRWFVICRNMLSKCLWWASLLKYVFSVVRWLLWGKAAVPMSATLSPAVSLWCKQDSFCFIQQNMITTGKPLSFKKNIAKQAKF